MFSEDHFTTREETLQEKLPFLLLIITKRVIVDLDNNSMINLFDNVVVECEANNFVESLGENVEEIIINGNVEEEGQDETYTQIVQKIKEGIEGKE